MVQTRQPDSALIGALRRADPIPYLEAIAVERARSGMPPATEMLAIEIRGDQPSGAAEEIAGLEGAEVLGPMTVEEGRRWLLSGNLNLVRKELRTMAGRWREAGGTVRIDVDPIDL